MVFAQTIDGGLAFVTWSAESGAADPQAQARHAYQEIAGLIRERKWVVLHERIFGDLAAAPGVLAVRHEAFASHPDVLELPPTYVEGASISGAGVAGIQLIAVRPSQDGSIEPVIRHGRVCGRLVEGGDACYLALSDVGRLLPVDDRRQPAVETAEVLMTAAAVLEKRGWSFRNILRTWFFLDDILSWYDDFNLIRNEMFHDQGLLMTTDSPQLPVSTGVSGRNHRKAWCTLDLLAIRPLAGKEIEFERLYNPRQNEAPEYGSAFSRGLSVATERCRYLLVSGTAAIDANGLSTHTGDFRRQVEETLGTVIELLLTAGSSQHHIVQATAFIKPGSDVGELRRILESQGFAGLPIVFVNGDICREELLFELDATALMPATGWTRDG